MNIVYGDPKQDVNFPGLMAGVYSVKCIYSKINAQHSLKEFFSEGVDKNLLYERLRDLSANGYISYVWGENVGRNKFVYFNPEKIHDVRMGLIRQKHEEPILENVGTIFDNGQGEFSLAVMGYKPEDGCNVPVLHLLKATWSAGSDMIVTMNHSQPSQSDLGRLLPVGGIGDHVIPYHEPLPKEWPLRFRADVHGSTINLRLPNKFYTEYC